MSHVPVRSQTSGVLWDAIAADTISAIDLACRVGAVASDEAFHAAQGFLQTVLDGIAVDRRIPTANICPPAATPAFGVALNIFLSSKAINSIAQIDKMEERTKKYLATIAALTSSAVAKPPQEDVGDVRSFFEELQSIVNDQTYQVMMARSRA